MMGEYMLSSGGVLFGGISDDRFLLKDVPAASSAFPREETPYEGAKPMLLVDSEDAVRIAEVVEAVLLQLPAPKKRPQPLGAVISRGPIQAIGTSRGYRRSPRE